jgi:aminopeptidase N
MRYSFSIYWRNVTMAITRKEEQRLLSHEEARLVAPSHHPALAELSPDDLRALAQRLRTEHGRARDMVREASRARRGKGEARGAASAAEKLLQKKQVFAAALRRVNGQFARKAEVRQERRAARQAERNTAALRQALERRRAQKPRHPQPGRTPGKGMRDTSHVEVHPGPDPRAIGSISQATRDQQARRDG